MISANLKGGIGNIMFEIAAVTAISLDTGYDAAFNRKVSGIAHGKIEKYESNILRNVRICDDLGFLNVYQEPRFSYTPLPIADNIMYDGHFQSEKYFIHRRKEILDLFSASKSFKESVSANSLDLSSACAVHVRRGDYLKYPDIHPVQSLDYYQKGLDILKESGCNDFLFFSDDIQWCKENFTGHRFYFIEGNEDWEDLWTMSLCKHHIIANSSFSWWGAWLGQREDSITISPKKWFGSKGAPDANDVYANNWLIL
jgi:hypothetical protein